MKLNSRNLIGMSSMVFCLFIGSSLASEKKINVLGVEIEDSELFDGEYLSEQIEKSKQSVKNRLELDLMFSDDPEKEIEPVNYRNIRIPEKRFMGFPIVCGEYNSNLNSSFSRFIYISSEVTLLENQSKSFESNWGARCVDI